MKQLHTFPVEDDAICGQIFELEADGVCRPIPENAHIRHYHFILEKDCEAGDAAIFSAVKIKPTSYRQAALNGVEEMRKPIEWKSISQVDPYIPEPPSNEIRIIRNTESAVIPSRQYPGDVGFDLTLSRDLHIDPLGFTDAHTDIRLELPEGYWGMITGRSSATRKHGVLVLTGIIDNGYRGDLHIAVQNLRDKPFFMEAGGRLAQFIIHAIHDFTWVEVEELSNSERGLKGFGSSGD